MLSHNFSLLQRSAVKQINKKNIWIIFSTLFLEMYDLILYIGHISYLSVTLLPSLKLYNSGIIFSLILCLSQFAKFTGFILFNMIPSKRGRIGYTNLIAFTSSYTVMTIVISNLPISHGIYLFTVCRVILSYFIGRELGGVIRLTSLETQKRYHNILYYLLLISSEVGAIVCIFINRLFLSYEVISYSDSRLWVYQLIGGVVFGLILLGVRYFFPSIQSESSLFTSNRFRFIIKAESIKIMLRALVLLMPEFLIFILICRLPTILYLGFGWNVIALNKLILIITVCAVTGSFMARFCSRYLSASIGIKLFYIISILIATIWMLINNNYRYVVSPIAVYSLALLYGGIIKLTPLYLFGSQEFVLQRMILCRYSSRALNHMVLCPLALLNLDYLYYLHKGYDTYSTPILVISIAILGFIGVIFYSRRV